MRLDRCGDDGHRGDRFSYQNFILAISLAIPLSLSPYKGNKTARVCCGHSHLIMFVLMLLLCYRFGFLKVHPYSPVYCNNLARYATLVYLLDCCSTQCVCVYYHVPIHFPLGEDIRY